MHRLLTLSPKHFARKAYMSAEETCICSCRNLHCRCHQRNAGVLWTGQIDDYMGDATPRMSLAGGGGAGCTFRRDLGHVNLHVWLLSSETPLVLGCIAVLSLSEELQHVLLETRESRP
eukprot:TRINITY_DN12141_c0_g1_i16.p1 TRINITY_DN12141_c0_g1~~TRINITY_DN12141_c0_g1_i16.p1  ORF type:complete len:118 (-),score=4.91 TRINITY_DN12141_c0_g1_i16:221-574(-)